MKASNELNHNTEKHTHTQLNGGYYNESMNQYMNWMEWSQ